MNRSALIGCACVLSAGVLGCDRSAPQPVATSQGTVSASDQASDAAVQPPNEISSMDVAEVDSNQDLSDMGADATRPGANGNGSDFTGQRQRISQIELEARPFATLQPITTSDPQALIEHLRQIDAALQDLVLAGSSNFLDESTFTAGGMRLGRMKQAAGAQLAASPNANLEQRKAGTIAQLVALSHMSGLRDVQAAQELERFATDLAVSGDADLAHQARVVLIGFELQALQNGLHQQPDALMAQVAELFGREQDRGFPEFMVLQEAQQVLSQMGFTDAAENVRQIRIAAYRTSPDAQLRGEAWLIEVQASQAYQNFLQAFGSLGSDEFDSSAALAALRGLHQAFPTLQTLEQIATTIANIEYSGQVTLSQDVASFTQQALTAFATADTAYIDKALSDHAARMKLVNSTPALDGLVGFDGQPLDWSAYEGKVVLVDFWASWCLKCMREIPAIRQAHQAFAEQGFVVLSINMDENLANGRDFVQQQNFPWRSFHSADPQALGFKSPLARQLGVNAIPFLMLVGRDGRVAELHVRGSKLRPAIEKLIGTQP